MSQSQTAGKAWAAALTTAIAVVLARLGFGEMPAEGEIAAALKTLAAAVGAAAAAFVTTWWKKNFPK